MKQLFLLALMALTLSLGVSCKKETEIVKEEVKVEKPVTKADADAIGNIFEYNENVYPHSTGICYCGQGPKCHPYVHKSWCLSFKTAGFVDYGCNCK